MSDYLWNPFGVSSILATRTIHAASVVVLLSAGAIVCAETPLTSLRNQSRQLLRQEATLGDGAEKDAALTALCDFYVVLRSDDRYGTSEMLQAAAAKVRRRLIQSAVERERRLKRDRIVRPRYLSAQIDQAIASAVADGQELGESMVGSGQGGGAVADAGWQLVELMQRVVAPDFWEPQGGPGVIRYFAMRRVLVVRATTDIHEQIKDLLTALR